MSHLQLDPPELLKESLQRDQGIFRQLQCVLSVNEAAVTLLFVGVVFCTCFISVLIWLSSVAPVLSKSEFMLG